MRPQQFCRISRPATRRGEEKTRARNHIKSHSSPPPTSHPFLSIHPQGESKKMAQGTIKVKKPSAATTARRPAALGPKKGARTIAPRKQTLVKNMKMAKVCFFSLFFSFCFYACCGWVVVWQGV
jgi:hypothetical protein